MPGHFWHWIKHNTNGKRVHKLLESVFKKVPQHFQDTIEIIRVLTDICLLWALFMATMIWKFLYFYSAIQPITKCVVVVGPCQSIPLKVYPLIYSDLQKTETMDWTFHLALCLHHVF